MKQNLGRQRSVIFTLLLSLLFTVYVKAGPVDELLRVRAKEDNIPGIAAVVIRRGKIVGTHTFGVASLEFNVPVTNNTVFEIGSVSKQITAAAIMLLVEDGKLSLDEPISKYMPQVPQSWTDVTVRHLLNHTSGIRSYSSLTGFELSNLMKADNFIEKLAIHPLEFSPGSKYKYNNSGYNLAAYLIETASGMSYMDFLRIRIFRPLEMNLSGDRDPQFIIKNRATGYEWKESRFVGRDGNLTDLKGAGSIVSTITDIAKWSLALRNDKLLKPASKATMWKSGVFKDGKEFPYGLGFRSYDIRGYHMIGHTGQTAGFGAAHFIFLKDDLSVIVFVNQGEIGLGGKIANGIAKIYIPDISLKAFKTSATVPDQDVEKVFKEALAARLQDKITTEIFTGKTALSLSTGKQKELSKRLRILGPPTKITFGGSERLDDILIHRFLVEHGKRIFLWRFSMDAAGKVSELSLEEEE